MQPGVARPYFGVTSGLREIVGGQRAVDDRGGHVDQATIVITAVAPQGPERLVHAEAQLMADHALGLLDDHPAVEGVLELLGEQA